MGVGTRAPPSPPPFQPSPLHARFSAFFSFSFSLGSRWATPNAAAQNPKPISREGDAANRCPTPRPPHTSPRPTPSAVAPRPSPWMLRPPPAASARQSSSDASRASSARQRLGPHGCAMAGCAGTPGRRLEPPTVGVSRSGAGRPCPRTRTGRDARPQSRVRGVSPGLGEGPFSKFRS